MTNSRRQGLQAALVTAALVVVLDHLTKWWAVSRLEPGPCTPETCIDVVGSLRFHLHYNFGASFSTGAGFGRLFGVLAIAMSIVMFRAARSADDRWSSILFGVVAGGALGNMFDRLFRAENGLMSGGVADFVDLQWWPIFNVADVAIVVGVILLVFRQYTLGEPEVEDYKCGDRSEESDVG